MKSSYDLQQRRAKLSRRSMTNYLIRSEMDSQMDVRIEQHKQLIWEELMAYAHAVDATLCLTLHQELGWGAKRIRKFYEAIIRNRVAHRLFYRDGTSYTEQATGHNAEDEAIVKELLCIGVDINAWEAEVIDIDNETGNVTFVPGEVDNG